MQLKVLIGKIKAILDEVIKNGKGLVIIVNKWDLITKTHFHQNYFILKLLENLNH